MMTVYAWTKIQVDVFCSTILMFTEIEEGVQGRRPPVTQGRSEGAQAPQP